MRGRRKRIRWDEFGCRKWRECIGIALVFDARGTSRYETEGLVLGVTDWGMKIYPALDPTPSAAHSLMEG